MISIVCVYNNKQVLDSCLLKDLNKQTVEFELILIDNTSGSFNSAAEALNKGGKKAKGKYLMFIHQDVYLPFTSWLENAEEWLDSIEKLGIAGVAGMSDKGKNNKARGRNIIKHGCPAKEWAWGNKIYEPEEVQTLDECLMIIPNFLFERMEFDEKTCNDWHLYGVDYCLSCIRQGFKAIVLPLEVYHASNGLHKTKIETICSLGSFPESYYTTLKAILGKHKNHYRKVYTTCGDWSTYLPLILQRMYKIVEDGMQILLREAKNYLRTSV